jgi:transcriptional regulator GlxA family with amidase domain
MPDRRVVIVTYPGMQTLDAVGPYEVFAGADRVVSAAGRPGGYRVDLVSVEGAPVRSESGVGVCTVPLPDASDPTDRIDTLIIPGGNGAAGALDDDALLDWLAEAAAGARRVATVCSGAFVAARLGLLQGRRVTTHWARADQLAAEYPDITVDPDPIYLRDGRFWSSAGVTAGIDLSLALVEDDLGTGVAQTVARWLVMFLHRPGGQTQFASPVWVPRAERSAVRAVQTLVESAPGGDHRIPAMAAAACMSERHFARVFTAEVGQTPGRFVERVRTEAARRQLEETGDTLGVIAARCGLGTAETLRRVFHRRLGVSPDAYRQRFRAPGAPGPHERNHP